MGILFQREIERLQRQVLALSAEVERDVRNAVGAVDERNPDKARGVIRREIGVNSMEVDVEEECLKILALHQPVASDLRYVIAVLRINHDLERIGDLAVHIAERALRMCELPVTDTPFRLGEMADKAQAMLGGVLDAFVRMDVDAARRIFAADGEVDEINRDTFERVREAVSRNPGHFDALIQVMHIARHIERIADHATNIAEDLVYLVEGRIVRHTPEAAHAPAAAGAITERSHGTSLLSG